MNCASIRRAATQKSVGRMSALILFGFGMHCILRGIAMPEIMTDFDLTYTEMSAIVSISSVGYLAMAMLSSKICEKIGQKNALSLFSAIIAASAFLLTISNTYLQLAILFMLAGNAYGGIECVVTAIVKRYNPVDSDRAVNNVFGFYSVGSLLIAVAGGWMIYKGMGWRAAYTFVSIAAFISFLYSLSLKDDSVATAPKVKLSDMKGLLNDRVFVVMCLATALLSGTEAASINWMNTFLSTTVTDMNIFESSCTTALFFAFIYVGRLAISELMNRFSSVTLTIVCSLITGAIVMLVSFINTSFMMLVFIALFGFFVSCLYPLLISITNGLASGGLIYSITFTTISVMNFTVNYLMGVVADAFDLPSTFRFCSVLYIIVAVAVCMCRKKVLERNVVGAAN